MVNILIIKFSPRPLSPRPSKAQISSSVPYSRTPSAYVPPPKWPNKLHIHIEERQTTVRNILAARAVGGSHSVVPAR